MTLGVCYPTSSIHTGSSFNGRNSHPSSPTSSAFHEQGDSMLRDMAGKLSFGMPVSRHGKKDVQNILSWDDVENMSLVELSAAMAQQNDSMLIPAGFVSSDESVSFYPSKHVAEYEMSAQQNSDHSPIQSHEKRHPHRSRKAAIPPAIPLSSTEHYQQVAQSKHLNHDTPVWDSKPKAKIIKANVSNEPIQDTRVANVAQVATNIPKLKQAEGKVHSNSAPNTVRSEKKNKIDNESPNPKKKPNKQSGYHSTDESSQSENKNKRSTRRTKNVAKDKAKISNENRNVVLDFADEDIDQNGTKHEAKRDVAHEKKSGKRQAGKAKSDKKVKEKDGIDTHETKSGAYVRKFILIKANVLY